MSLQGIGIFKLKPDIILPTEGDKDFSIPADAFSFEYNLKIGEDEGLVNYIVQQTRKIKPLASSDLESYAILSKQFLNIGKPFIIEGIGTIQKNQQGEYGFIAGQFITPKMDDSPVQLKERKDETVSFESEHVTENSGKTLKIILTITTIALAGLTLYYFMVVKKPAASESIEQTVSTPDTVNTNVNNSNVNALMPAGDSVNKNTIDSNSKPAATAVQPIKAGNSSFKVVLKEYNSQHSVQSAYNRLTSYGHKLEIIKIDSVKYKLVMPFSVPLSDSLRVKDSLKIFFGGKPYIQY